MTEFNKTNWAKAEFGQRFIEEAEISVVERRRMLEILKSFFRRHRKETGGNTVLDLGCGDGILTHELLAVDPWLSATLVDGSAAMLERAKNRLEGSEKISYVQASFQEMLKDTQYFGTTKSKERFSQIEEEWRMVLEEVAQSGKELNIFKRYDDVVADSRYENIVRAYLRFAGLLLKQGNKTGLEKERLVNEIKTLIPSKFISKVS